MNHQNGSTTAPNPVNRVAGQIPPLNTVGDGATPPPSAPPAGRDTGTGKFTAGNTHGRGNPFARQMAAARRALLATVTTERLKALGEKLCDAAVGGDWVAAKLVLAYIVGKPGKAPDPDRLDLDEWLLLQENPTKAEVMRAILDDCPPADAAEAVRAFEVKTAATDSAGGLIGMLCDDDKPGTFREALAERKAKRQRRR